MEHKEVIEHYNNGQDEYENRGIYKNYLGDYVVKIYYEYDSETKTICKEIEIGFYEWLFNPKYKVFEVFKLGRADMEENIFEVSWVYNYTTKQPQEILDYLKNQIRKYE
jgi:hypothetical protein